MSKKPLKSIAVMLLCLGIVLNAIPLSTIFAAARTMPINNTGFEYVDKNARPTGWSAYGDSATSVSQSVYAVDYQGSKRLQVTDASDSLTSGMESEKVSVNQGDSYTVTAEILVENGTAEMVLNYYNAYNEIIQSVVQKVYGPSNEWEPVVITSIAPENVVKANIIFRCSVENIGKFYADNLVFRQEPLALAPYLANLGPQVNNVSIPTGAIGKDASGKDVIYTVVTGDPGIFVVVDVNTKEVLKKFDLPGVTGTWTVIQASDGTVYIGGYNSAYLYRYFPQDDKLINLGMPIPGSSVNYSMSESKDGRIFGGANPSGRVWEYDPVTGEFYDLGQLIKGSEYARTVYDPVNNKLYGGAGMIPAVIEFDLNNPNYRTDPAARKDILPAEYRAGMPKNLGVAYDMNVIDGRLIVKNGNFITIVIDLATAKAITITDTDAGTSAPEFTMYSRGVTPKSPIDNQVYLTVLGFNIASLNMDTYTLSKVKDRNNPGTFVNGKGSIIASGYCQLAEEGFPGYTLVALTGNGGLLLKYNLETGNTKVEQIVLPAQPVLINNIHKGSDGKIYSMGYLSGNAGVLSPTAGITEFKTPIGQAEGVTTLGGKIYFGVYPYAVIYELDPTKAWKKNVNPVEKFRLVGDEFGKQDRPYAMLGVEEENKVFIGTVPDYGLNGGAFTVYEPSTGKKTVYSGSTSIAPDQSIVSLAYKDGKVYIGTSTRGGINSVDKTDEGRLIVWDVASNKAVYETVPVAGKRSVQGLMVGPDGNIWGMANGILFIFHPQTKQIVYSDAKTPPAGNWRDAFLTIGTDGNVYGTAGNSFFKIDAVTKEMTTIMDRGVFGLAQDDFGNIYMRNGTELLRYSHPGLVLKLSGAVISVSNTSLQIGKTATINVTKGLLEKGRSTKELSGATMEYFTSNSDVVSVENGVIAAKRRGTAEVWANVTLDGVTVESNKVTINVKNTDATLKDLRVNGQTVAGFAYDQYEYTYELPYGTSIIPAVEATSNDTYATVKISQAGELPGVAIVEVMSEDGITIQVYKVNFVIEPQDNLFKVSSVKFTDLSGQEVTQLKDGTDLNACVDIMNNTDRAMPATLIIALFNSDDTIVNWFKASQQVDAGKTVTLEAGFRLPDKTDGYYVKVFVWDSWEGMRSLADSVYFPSRN